MDQPKTDFITMDQYNEFIQKKWNE